MTPEAQTEIAHLLEESRRDLHAAVEGVTESQAAAKPESGRWSILECVEHVATVEQRFLTRLAGAKRLDGPRVDRAREAEFAALIVSRAKPLQAPEAVRPTGRFATLTSALEHFDATRSQAVAKTAELGPALYALEVEHPRFGMLNGTELMILLAGHARRHAAQIREIREGS